MAIDSPRTAVLTPPLSPSRDHVEGPPWAPSLVVFGSYGTPASRPLGRLLPQLREAHPASLCLAWRHLPAGDDHPTAGATPNHAERVMTSHPIVAEAPQHQR